MPVSYSTPGTRLARQMGALHEPGLTPLTRKQSFAVNRILRDLDEEERGALAFVQTTDLAGSIIHMLDGTGRVWHFAWDGAIGWNDHPDYVLEEAEGRARALGWEEVA